MDMGKEKTIASKYISRQDSGEKLEMISLVVMNRKAQMVIIEDLQISLKN